LGSGYDSVLGDIVHPVDAARRGAVRSVNAIMTAAYWTTGRRIVEQEQKGAARANYGEGLIVRLSNDLQARFGRGFWRDPLPDARLLSRAQRDSPDDVWRVASGQSARESPDGV
jgi:hypothetical protein